MDVKENSIQIEEETAFYDNSNQAVYTDNNLQNETVIEKLVINGEPEIFDES